MVNEEQNRPGMPVASGHADPEEKPAVVSADADANLEITVKQKKDAGKKTAATNPLNSKTATKADDSGMIGEEERIPADWAPDIRAVKAARRRQSLNKEKKKSGFEEKMKTAVKNSDVCKTAEETDFSAEPTVQANNKSKQADKKAGAAKAAKKVKNKTAETEITADISLDTPPEEIALNKPNEDCSNETKVKKTAKSKTPKKSRKKAAASLLAHTPNGGHAGGRRETDTLWQTSIAKLTEAAEREKQKINSSNKQFLLFLVKLFVILMFGGSIFMFYIWNGLETYEKNTPNGAMTQYVQLLRSDKYEKIYENSQLGFTQLNDKEHYIDYLKSLYEDIDLKDAVFTKKSYSDENFLYYDLMVDNQKISTLELRYVESEKRWNARTVISSRNFYIDVIGNPEVYVNGVALDDSFITEQNVASEAYSNLYDSDLAPLVTRYHIDNLVDVPTVTTQDAETYVVVKDALKDQFYIASQPNGAMEEIMRSRIRDTATAYAKYISEDTTFADLRQYLYRRTDYYKAISSFNNRYFTTHDSYRFDNVEISDLIFYGEDEGFTGTISFDYVVTIEGKKSQTYSNSYQMTFIKADGQWLCSDLVIANQSSAE